MQRELIEKIFRKCRHKIRVKIARKINRFGNLFSTILRYEVSSEDDDNLLLMYKNLRYLNCKGNEFNSSDVHKNEKNDNRTIHDIFIFVYSKNATRISQENILWKWAHDTCQTREKNTLFWRFIFGSFKI